jgi:S1-C subfamily serine protease
VPGSPAERAGLRRGDEIVGLDDRRIDDPQAVSDAVGARQPGDRVKLRVRRGGATQELDARLGLRPKGTP